MTETTKTVMETKEQLDQQSYTKRKKREENHPLWLLNNTYLCHDGKSLTNNNKKKQLLTTQMG